ncbi:hypothetical protein BN874_1890006 [Candidatus Contendobacter odensis Run_B_J11]|uniref:Uncharacterized protein n=1 Tax=Candidatus Contendobacter odensis Run_B_J11 TaxID=1400861 RepID=A0A7U7GAB4_9GAMM|nr:hypothetical protein BN874_1890006 [Candidatus Contendobacter odensis Run_B_J11]
MMQLVVEYPDVLPDALRVSRNEFEQEARIGDGGQTVRVRALNEWSGGAISRVGACRIHHEFAPVWRLAHSGNG